MREAWLLLHIVAVAIWVGGMFFAHHCLRPAAAALDPPPRLTLMSAVLARFFAVLRLVIAALWVSGLAMLLAVGFAHAPLGWHLMLGLGAVMTVIFALIAWRLHPRLAAAVVSQRWAEGAAALADIRRWVAINLVLGMVTIAVATIGRWLG